MILFPEFDAKEVWNPDFISHYTKAKTGIENILYTHTLKVPSKKTTDDPIENKTYQFTGIAQNEDDLRKFGEFSKNVTDLLNSTRLVCFCKNAKMNKDEAQFGFHKGYIRSRMWSQYGDHHTGMCFIFSKKKLLNCVRKQYSKDFIILRKDVSYSNKTCLQRSIYTLQDRHYLSNATNFVKQNRKVYFFSKVQDYQDETEFRIVLIKKQKGNFDNIYIDYEDSLLGVICGEKLHPAYLPSIIKKLDEISVPGYQMIWDYGIPKLKKITS